MAEVDTPNWRAISARGRPGKGSGLQCCNLPQFFRKEFRYRTPLGRYGFKQVGGARFEEQNRITVEGARHRVKTGSRYKEKGFRNEVAGIKQQDCLP
jgi:hypothetical protein